MLKDGMSKWSASDSEELYEVARWGKGYFSVGRNGNLLVHPERDPSRQIDLKQLVDRLVQRGIELPVLVRFNDILKDRLSELAKAFQTAIDEYGYQGTYSCVYPIKVNQQRQVVEKILDHGKCHGIGLEAGSKPELLAVVAMIDDETPIICNGFKDSEFIQMALLAQKIGRRVIPVVEKYTELTQILNTAEELGIRPQIGMRVKLASLGAGRWKSSGGYRSKFGLTVTEVLRALEELKSRDMQDCFQLLHFHLGSQITNIRHVKSALNEATRIYVDLVKREAGLRLLDIGGGLGVDYDGSQTNFESSVNYSLQEYANDVIHHIQSVCQDANIPSPDIISESGRAVAAYHSLLVFEVLGVASPVAEPPPKELPSDSAQPLVDLFNTLQSVTFRNAIESFHDAQQAFEMAIQTFATGHLSLSHRSIAERLFWAVCEKIRHVISEQEYVSEELSGLDRLLAETYFCNFSLFQSLPDSWAIKQLFPVLPIHRLDSQPTINAILGDITCDSDGKMDQFINRRDVAKTLPLHRFGHEPYYLATFLVGAYQEILGDLHNLFGDTNAVHIDLNDTNEIVLDSIIKGDTVAEVLHYVQFNPEELLSRLQTSVEKSVQLGKIDHRQAGSFLKFYEQSLNGYTYLE